jgi:hypothetical protein
MTTFGTRIAVRWNRVWFEPVPPEIFALLRIVFGFLGLLVVVELVPVSMFWAIDGISPLPGHGFGLRSTVLAHGWSAAAGWAYFLVMLTAFTCMCVGYRTRTAILVAWIGTIALNNWNHLPLTSAVHVLACVLFYLWWADCSGAPSVDAGRSNRSSIQHDPGTQPIWPLLLIRVQVCFIYLNSGLWKFMYATWRDGTAVHYAVSHDIFHRFPIQVPPTLAWLTTLATYVTLAWEIGFMPMMLHRVSRRIALVLGVAMHLGMWLMLELGPFSWVMIATYIAFLNPSAVATWLRARNFQSRVLSSAAT